SMSTKPVLAPRGLIFDSITFGYVLGVVAYYLFRPSEDFLLSVGLVAGVSAALLFAGAVIAFVLFRANILTLGQHIFEPSHVKVQREPKSMFKTFWGWELLITFTLTLIVGGQ